VPVSIEEYEQVRQRGDWFVILPGHEKLDVERVVRENRSFLVVEKLSL
jgi:hypothetical protein